ncbi:hypothetical protein [Wolbachia endosymbiont (group A) of Ophion ellenae]|uniref:hypothetical protein n=1 Tax=Wolbachia endosymbiont (group A) of Ophion ellenae TaxID=3066210 RepID=UPI0030D1B026
MKVADTGSFMTAVPRGVIPVLDTGIQFLLPGVKLSFLDSSGLCCIASYDGLKIKKIANISSLLFWYL